MRKKKEKVDNVILLPKKLVKFREVKADDSRRHTYRSFGVFSVFESLIAVIFSMCIFLATGLKLDNPLLFILLEILLYTLATAVPLIALGNALIDLVLQLRLNRQQIGIMALLFFAAALIGVIFIILGGLGTLG